MVSPVFAYLIKTRGIQELLLPVNALTILHGQTCGCCRTEQEEQKQETPNTHPALLPSFCTGAMKGGLFSGSCVEFSAKLTGSFYALFTEFQADPAVQLAKIHSHLLSKQPRNSCSMCTSVWDTTFSPFPRWTQTHLRVMAGWRTSKTRFANERPVVLCSWTQRACDSSQNSSLHKVSSENQQLCFVSTNSVAFRIPRARAELPAKSKELLGLNATPECAALPTSLDLELSLLLALFQHFHPKSGNTKSLTAQLRWCREGGKGNQ